MSHPELGKKILDQVAEAVAAVAKVESAAKLDGRNMIMVLAPDRRSQVRKHATDGEAAPDAVAGSEPLNPSEPVSATVAASPRQGEEVAVAAPVGAGNGHGGDIEIATTGTQPAGG